MEADQFVGKVLKVGDSLMVTIPANNVKFSELEEGDIIRVWYSKKRE